VRSDRPSDHIDNEAPADDSVSQPKLGFVGYLRFFWRQLTSMRTALFLLLLLALAAIPGSLVPQTTSDPNGVLQFQQRDPETFKVLDSLGLFSTFESPWFSAVYLLLFISLVGCIIPRTKYHFDAMRARPPKTPARLERLVGFTTAPTGADAGLAIDEAAKLLKRQGYRTERYGGSTGSTSESVSAERGYLRETGNLVFHTALVGMLLVVGVGGGFGYTGQRILVQGEAFTNVRASYDSFAHGRFYTESALEPYSMRLDDFEASYESDVTTGSLVWHPKDFTASLSTRTPGGDWTPAALKINAPITIGGTDVYLLGNGYAPVITVRDAGGEVVYSGAVPFLQLNANLASRGVVKVPDGLSQQIALFGFFYPDPVPLTNGMYDSFSPTDHGKSLLSLNVYAGDLGLDTGAPVNAYTLDTSALTQIAGPDADAASLQLNEGDVVDLPDGLGTVEYEGLKRYVSVDIHHDITATWALVFALLILGGLLVSLFVPRRRVWVKAVGGRLEYAGLARGEDPTLAAAVADLARRHREALGDPEPQAETEPRMDA
jgi:cytochrome c biogenesis protein